MTSFSGSQENIELASCVEMWSFKNRKISVYRCPPGHDLWQKDCQECKGKDIYGKVGKGLWEWEGGGVGNTASVFSTWLYFLKS